MECRCFCDVDDVAMTLCNITTPVARKQHRCCECGELIEVGERYERAETLFDGEWETFKSHLSCAKMRKDHCCDFGEVRAELWDCLGIDPFTGKIAYWAAEHDAKGEGDE